MKETGTRGNKLTGAVFPSPSAFNADLMSGSAEQCGDFYKVNIAKQDLFSRILHDFTVLLAMREMLHEI